MLYKLLKAFKSFLQTPHGLSLKTKEWGTCKVDPAETRTPAVRTVWGTYEGYETSETCFGKPSACVISLQLAFIPKAAQILRSKKISNPNPAPSANPNPRIGDFGKMPDFAFDSL